MYQISDQQIDFILSDISARGVEMESLQQNLLDHICCIIEHDLEENGDFENFYQRTMRTFYKDALWEIEEETLQLLIFKNYYTMKKIMIVSGTFSAAVMSIGIFFKFMHWPGAAICILLGIAVSSLVFLPLLFTLKAKEKQNSKDKLILGIATLAGVLISLSILFKVMHWPGANMMGVSFVGLMALVYIPVNFFTGIKNPESKVNTIVTTCIMIMGCGLFLTLVNTKPTERPLDNTEIEVYVINEEMIKSEAEKLYAYPATDSLSNKAIARVKEIVTICASMKSDILMDETGYAVMSRDLKNKNIIISNRLLSNYIDQGFKEKLEKLSALINSFTKEKFVEDFMLKKANFYPAQIMFPSSLLSQDYDFILYNNTVFGVYKDLSEIQLEAIEYEKEIQELKEQKLTLK
jgi:hypothetical protein